MKDTKTKMKAAYCEKYGSPDVIQIRELPIPAPKPNQILVKVAASAVNSADWRLRKPDPWGVRLFLGLVRPRMKVMGINFSGEVIETGSQVTSFNKGDKIFGSTGMKLGAYAQYLVVGEKAVIAKMPAQLNFIQAAALPFGFLTALHYLRKSDVKKSDSVLVVGASGSVGTATVQLAKNLGAHVTAACSSSNFELVKNLGADEILDYRSSQYQNDQTLYDAVIDTVGFAPWKTHLARVKKNGSLVLIAAGALKSLYLPLLQLFCKPRLIAGVASEKVADLQYLADLANTSDIKIVVDRTYPLEEIVEAHRYVEAGHKKGNVVVMIS